MGERKISLLTARPVHLTRAGFFGGVNVSLVHRLSSGIQAGNSIHTSALGVLNPWTGGNDWGTEQGQQG